MKVKRSLLLKIIIKVAATHFLSLIKRMLVKRVLFRKVGLEVTTINLNSTKEAYPHQASASVTSRH